LFENAAQGSPDEVLLPELLGLPDDDVELPDEHAANNNATENSEMDANFFMKIYPSIGSRIFQKLLGAQGLCQRFCPMRNDP
jgi:hypothetical protein